MRHQSCCVVNCKNTGRKSKCKFYKFPTVKWKINQRNQWIAAVKRLNADGSQWVPKPYDCICSDHFIGGKKSEAELSPSYIPTIFPSIYKSSKVNKSSARERKEQDVSTDPPFPISTVLLPEAGLALGSNRNGDEELIPSSLVNMEVNEVPIKEEPIDNEEEPCSSRQQDDGPIQDLLQEETEPVPRTRRKATVEKKHRLRETVYCRLCLKVVTGRLKYTELCPIIQGKGSEKLTELRSMLQALMPDLDLTLTFNPVICDSCTKQATAAHKFLSNCRASEESLLDYKQQHPKEPFVDIEEVLSKPGKRKAEVPPSAEQIKRPLTKRDYSRKNNASFVDPVSLRYQETGAESSKDVPMVQNFVPELIKIEPEMDTETMAEDDLRTVEDNFKIETDPIELKVEGNNESSENTLAAIHEDRIKVFVASDGVQMDSLLTLVVKNDGENG